jgi:tetratricopeptide (TPR) repeat protein
MQCAGSQQKGDTYLSGNKFDEAIKEYKSLIARSPGNYKAYLNLGDAYLGKNEFNLALAAFTDALRLKPEWDEVQSRIPLVRMQQGQDFEKKGFDREALDIYESLMRKYSDFLPVYATLVGIYERKGDTAGALKAYEVIAQHSGGSALRPAAVKKVKYYDSLAQALHKNAMDDYESTHYYESAENFNKYLAIKPDDKEAGYLRYMAEGLHVLSRGKSAEMVNAIDSFSSAASAFPVKAEPYFHMAQAYERQRTKDYSNSIKFYQKVFEIAPGTEMGRESEMKVKQLTATKKTMESFFKKKR